MPACKFFAQGRCTYGASCRNTHEAANEAPPQIRRKLGSLTSAPQGNLPKPTATTSKPTQKTQENTSKSICWHFTQGKCTYGAKCRLLHETPALQTDIEFTKEPSPVIGAKELPKVLKPDALVFQPSLISRPEPLKPPEACYFFGKGFCREGLTCRFRHETATGPGVEESLQQIRTPIQEEKPLLELVKELLIADSTIRAINGATVTFREGAQVSNVKLSSDFSTIQMSGLPADGDVKLAMKILSDMQFQVADSSNISIRRLGDMSVAEITLDDPSFATNVVGRFEKGDWGYKNLSIKPIISSGGAGELGNRLQLSTIACTWYQASRIAWLEYATLNNAQLSKVQLSDTAIRQRTPTCTIQMPRYAGYGSNVSRNYTLQLGSLHPKTSEKDIKFHLRGSLIPRKVSLGLPSHSMTDDEAAAVVEELLRAQGSLESFQHEVTKATSKIKATAIFTSKDDAAKAVRSMHDTTISQLGNSKLYVAHVLSVKYNILTAIIQALRTNLDSFRDRIWHESHLQLKIYPQVDRTKPFTAMRLFGEDVKAISKSKVELEKMLTGEIVKKDDLVLWDSWFSQPLSLVFLNELSQAQKVYLYRNNRRSHLVLYGASPNQTSEIVRTLTDKLSTLNTGLSSIILTPELLSKAMQGGMKRLKSRFGDSVRLNVALDPKTISINGSAAQIQEAREILSASEASTDDQGTEDCVVCWTEATDALFTSCSHVYCKECFSNQVSSSGAPVRCYGAEGKCEKVLSMNELEKLLPYAELESLLQESFEAFIRVHPKDFQFCPTPDCPQIYRISSGNTSHEFFCSSCLSTICTSCQVINHDGMSCEEYRDLSSEGTLAFKKWKTENDVRDCPSCKIGIQKSYGCNHMTCQNCSKHICWFCMQVFETGPACYDHMEKVHKNIYAE